MTNILGGHGGRLFSNLRDRDSLAYTVSPIVSYGCHPGVVGSYVACAPTKVEQALSGLKTEMASLKETPPTEAEVDRSRNYIIGSHDMGLQRSDSQTSTMALMELYGYGYDDFLKYPKAVAKVTAADVQRVANRLIEDSQAVTVVVGPKP
jgi:zinc protease